MEVCFPQFPHGAEYSSDIADIIASAQLGSLLYTDKLETDDLVIIGIRNLREGFDLLYDLFPIS